MTTEIGKFLRHLRIDHDETIKEMADKLEISTALLSSIENGKKKALPKLIDSIKRIYKLDDEQKKALDNANDITEGETSIDLTKLSDEKQDVTLRFARSIENSKADIKDILQELLDEEIAKGKKTKK